MENHYSNFWMVAIRVYFSFHNFFFIVSTKTKKKIIKQIETVVRKNAGCLPFSAISANTCHISFVFQLHTRLMLTSVIVRGNNRLASPLCLSLSPSRSSSFHVSISNRILPIQYTMYLRGFSLRSEFRLSSFSPPSFPHILPSSRCLFGRYATYSAVRSASERCVRVLWARTIHKLNKTACEQEALSVMMTRLSRELLLYNIHIFINCYKLWSTVVAAAI